MHLYELKNAGIEAINRIFQLLYAIGEEYNRWFDEVSLCDYHLLISMAETVDRLSFDYVMIKYELEAAEARAEKAEREKNYAIELLRGICYACRNYSAHCHKGKCNNCKWDRTYDYDPNGNEDNWEWCGLKEE